MDEKKVEKVELKIEELEERIAPGKVTTDVFGNEKTHDTGGYADVSVTIGWA